VQTRILSSFAVVLIGLAPTLVGGPVFALLLVMLGIAGFREYLELAARIGPGDIGNLAGISSYGIVAFALAALFGGTTIMLFAATALALVLPLVFVMATSNSTNSILSWSLVGTGALYLGLPMFAAILLRSIPGDVGAPWLADLAGRLSLGWTSYPRGLAWAVLAIVATWIGDSSAYLAGRGIGGRKLAPRISPNKTIAGAVAGLIGSACVGALAFHMFALGNPGRGLIAGGLIGAAGQFGDLAESFLKRQAGVKDSGALIPGHGGLLDRIDALLFAFPAGLLIATSFDWLQSR
jgi:phosphatidate cytidylyltransferase